MKEFVEKPLHSPDNYSNFQLGKYIKTDWEEMSAKSIVLITIDEYRGSDTPIETSFGRLRKALYNTMAGNWKIPLIDIGTIKAGHSREDTYYALKEVILYCLQRNAIPLLIGGSQDLVYPMYQALTSYNNPLNYTAVDSTIPLTPEPHPQLQESDLLNHLLEDENHLLFQFTNIGYQSYYTSYQIIDTLHAMEYDSIRLGEITADLKEAEPIFRSTDLASVNLNALESFFTHDKTSSSPNGFNSREICAITKYMGLSPQIKAAGIFNYFENSHNTLLSDLCVQMIWYYLEGRNAAFAIDKTQKKYKKYTVLHEDKEIIFYKDEAINKWWIVLQASSDKDETLIPCSEKDYEKAKNNEIPDRYWKNLKRFL